MLHQPISLLPSLLLICHVAAQPPPAPAPPAPPQYTNPLPTAYIPVGVGSIPDPAKLEDFGVFGKYLGDDVNYKTCGQKTVKTLNPQFTDSATEATVICEPRPDRVIVRADGAAFDYKTFKRDLKQECELFTCSDQTYPKAKTILGTMDITAFVPGDGSNNMTGKDSNKDVKDVDVEAANPENPETNICKDKRPGYSQKTGAILFANEGKCLEMHKLGRDKYSEEYIQVPRWLQPGESVKNIRPFFFDGQRPESEMDIEFANNRIMFKTPNSMDSLNYKDCNTACDSGKVVKVTMKKSAYRIALALDPNQCSSFRICIAPNDFLDDVKVPECMLGNQIDVMFKTGVVTWPNKGRASLIELMSPYSDLQHPVVIEFGYGVGAGAGASRAEYYIGNDHREIVTSSSNGFKAQDSQQLVFFFPTESCLKPKAGIFSKHIESAKALTSKDVIKGGSYDSETLEPVQAPQNEEPPTTTTPRTAENFVPTSTMKSLELNPLTVIIDANDNGPGSSKSDTVKSERVFVKGKWWWWAIYLGFVIGTLITLAVGGGLFYVLRRTVFGIWYRGMYKRYGCDPSGTTGGITGIGFGNTVTGDVTVQETSGNTTGGGTTTNTTVSETSTLLDKTTAETNKSIAM
ncbi:Endo/exonuclease/phosphatase domain-containing protein [Caenorhabditis elegans]|uniref:Endo/exonuclease/phosphatase domain-containing protein n=1 Tax=Caenorhabditis elegans TaxID=6239 RepID=O44527_CAEEL|nr:Endo/exonuclease/phosphatase domain-containing protein [Caenorhabditis elegans]CCD73993.1 Endo/exonuclease/phosphatase domain-containing protein [Caenorhabditis elegans]|eukprot:NP_500669.2 Uncharacterized protein CELE_T08B6.4 [Caenorhabditis elegans]